MNPMVRPHNVKRKKQKARESLEKPRCKWSWGKSRKKWIEVVEKDLKTLGVEDWREAEQNRDGSRSTVLAAKTLIE